MTTDPRARLAELATGDLDAAEALLVEARRRADATASGAAWTALLAEPPSEAHWHRLDRLAATFGLPPGDPLRAQLAAHDAAHGARTLARLRATPALDAAWLGDDRRLRLERRADGTRQVVLDADVYLPDPRGLPRVRHFFSRCDWVPVMEHLAGVLPVTGLEFPASFSVAGLERLSRSPAAAHLETLACHPGDFGIWDEEALSLARSGAALARLAEAAPRLRELVLRNVDLREGSWLTGPGWTSLRALDLSSNTAVGLHWLGDALARARGLVALEALDVSNCWVGDAVVEAIVANPALGRLRVLDLSGTTSGQAGFGLTDEGAALLSGCPRVAGLERLWIDGTRAGTEAACAIADSPYLGGLTHLGVAVGELAVIGDLIERLSQLRVLRLVERDASRAAEIVALARELRPAAAVSSRHRKPALELTFA